MLNSFHMLAFAGVALLFALVGFVIFYKVKNLQAALAFYFVDIVFSAIVLYSLLLYVEEKTKQASISEVKYARNLRTESVLITGRVTNTTKYPINKCFLDLTITDKVGGGSTAFDPKSQKNVQRGGASNSVNYVVQIISQLPGNTYKDFSVSVPFPPQFLYAEFYHILNCI